MLEILGYCEYSMFIDSDDYLYNDKRIEEDNIENINEMDNKIKSLEKLNSNGNISVSVCDNIIKKNNIFFEEGILSEDIKRSYSLYMYIDSKEYVQLQDQNLKNMKDLYSTINYWYDLEYKNDDSKKLYYNMIAYWYLILRVNYKKFYYTSEMLNQLKK